MFAHHHRFVEDLFDQHNDFVDFHEILQMCGVCVVCVCVCVCVRVCVCVCVLPREDFAVSLGCLGHGGESVGWEGVCSFC